MNREQPTLSICIPTRNRAPYLERCLAHLEGALALGFPVEIVVSDNASEDDTAEVCARFADRLPLRVERHSEDVGAERNVVNALRAARGRLAVYLGDDDRLDLERLRDVVGLFDDNPGLVCVQAPWMSQDDATGRAVGRFYSVPEPAAFGAGQAWPCWQFLLKHRVFPEIAVYRTADLHPILHLPRTVHWAFVWCFRLLGRGTVAFLPVPFYIHVVRPAPDLPPRRQLGVTQSTTHLDRYRGGLEWALAAALRQSVGHVPEENRLHAMRLLDRFIAERADVAARIAAGQADFITAIEHHVRGRVWEAGVDRDAIQRFEQEHTMLASLQALAEVAAGTAGCERIALVGVSNADRAATLLTQLFGWDRPVDVLDAAVDRDLSAAVALVMDREGRAVAEAAGALPGRVIDWSELTDCFRVHNVLGAISRRRAA